MFITSLFIFLVVFAALLVTTLKPKRFPPEKQLLSVCMDIFMAGSETTSNTLAFIIHHMLRYPEIQQRVQKEIDDVVGRGRLPTISDRASMPYTEAVIMEVQRMNSSVPIPVPHRAIKDCEILRYKVPKNTIIFLSLHSVHMDRGHWGDPDNFRPERFLDATGEKFISDDWFMPFGNGKHRCMGETVFPFSLHHFYKTSRSVWHQENNPQGIITWMDSFLDVDHFQE